MPSPRPLLSSLPSLAGLLLLLPLPAAGQGSGSACDIVAGEVQILQTGGGNQRNFMWDGVEVRCDDGTRIWADSAVVFQATNFTQLFRNVRFFDGESELTADRAHHFSRENRLVAWGGAVLSNEAEGSVIMADTIVINQANERRPRDQLTASGGRPRALLYLSRGPSGGAEEDSAVALDTLEVEESPEVTEPAEPPDTSRVPYDIVANRIYIEGSEYLRATGAAEITRDSLKAFADSVEYDRGAERLVMRGNARVSQAEYDLTARTLTLLLPGEEIEEVVARDDAVLTAERVRLKAPRIHVYLADGVMDRLVALDRSHAEEETGGEAEGVGERSADDAPGEPGEGEELHPSRPEALAEQFLLVADSIEILTPGEVLEQVFAAGDARGESTARDSLNTDDTPEIIRRDWLEGDTIIATFARIPTTAGTESGEPVPLDSTGNRIVVEAEEERGEEYELERLVARVDARSLYRLEASDTTGAVDRAAVDSLAVDSAAVETASALEEERLAVHYVTGSTIIIHLKDGEVQRMEVEGARGIHMEPVRRRGTSVISQEDRRGGNR